MSADHEAHEHLAGGALELAAACFTERGDGKQLLDLVEQVFGSLPLTVPAWVDEDTASRLIALPYRAVIEVMLDLLTDARAHGLDVPALIDRAQAKRSGHRA